MLPIYPVLTGSWGPSGASETWPTSVKLTAQWGAHQVTRQLSDKVIGASMVETWGNKGARGWGGGPDPVGENQGGLPGMEALGSDLIKTLRVPVSPFVK